LKSKIDALLKAGLINDIEYKRCNIIRDIRNIMAHDWKAKEKNKVLILKLNELYVIDHSEFWVFVEDIVFLLQMIYGGSCSKQVFDLKMKYNLM
jgi:hypothetical protein